MKVQASPFFHRDTSQPLTQLPSPNLTQNSVGQGKAGNGDSCNRNFRIPVHGSEYTDDLPDAQVEECLVSVSACSPHPIFTLASKHNPFLEKKPWKFFWGNCNRLKMKFSAIPEVDPGGGHNILDVSSLPVFCGSDSAACQDFRFAQLKWIEWPPSPKHKKSTLKYTRLFAVWKVSWKYNEKCELSERRVRKSG